MESPKDASSVQLPSPCSAFLVDGSIQPRSDWVLSLVPSEAELIATMHQKARYSIQYAQRKGAVVKVVSEKYEEYLKDFCRLMQETARRDGFVPHPDSYYQALFSELRQDQGFLVVGSHSGECVAIALVLVYGKTATYVFGASSNTHRNISVPALVQWQAIVEAKRRGCAEYSFGGASSSRFPVKSWAGITAFKQRFGGYAQDHSPVIDLVFQSSWYRVFVARKWLRHYFHI
ncbi:peptidoglycan bridge formation glycyltransferase FemA/FemB family protein [bacterium]|nr:peptidoglycan bridge formation glycyltransferase FemA/FemB family protein [bacterium]